ncbi:MAG TPA: HIT family protein [Ktedonobacterales bacterium]|nr:HIT family protein [Ktedonobacterales bacterium]
MEDCVFCKIIAGELPAAVVYRDETVMAFMSLQQLAEGHTLVIPIEHHKNIYDLPNELAGPLLSAAASIARGLKREFNADGIWVSQFNEPAAGQSVFHIHLHVIPRYVNDNLLKGFHLPDPSDMTTLQHLAARVRRGMG